jgi:hypothetical protein
MAVSDLTWGTSVIEAKKLDLGSWVKAQYSVSKPSIQTKAQYSGGSRPNQNRNHDRHRGEESPASGSSEPAHVEPFCTAGSIGAGLDDSECTVTDVSDSD